MLTTFSRVARACAAIVVFGALYAQAAELKEPLDRDEILARHRIVTTSIDELLPIGNGNFCFNVDGTGMQTFSGDVLSHWGWFAEPLPDKYSWKDVPATGTYWKGRLSGGDPFPADKGDLYGWIRNNPHQANLARVRLTSANGEPIKKEQIVDVRRSLDLATGLHVSTFLLDGAPVAVVTTVGSDVNLDSTVALRVESPMIRQGTLRVAIDFPYPTLQRGAWTGEFGSERAKTTTRIERKDDACVFVDRTLITEYAEGVVGNFSHAARVDAQGGGVAIEENAIVVKGRENATELDVLLTFDGGDYCGAPCDRSTRDMDPPTVDDVERQSRERWANFWRTGGAVDLSGSEDPRWFELERRIVLSQFVLRTNSAGSWPSSESGLMAICPWSGRFHMEMVWQHLSHWWVWDRAELADDAIKIYWQVAPAARALAEQLGYKGLKWQKEIAPDGRTAPWVGNLALLWKQPHPIHFAELDYRRNPTKENLEKWQEIVEQTAEHMADYATRDENGVYHLDPVMPPDEQGFTKDDLFDLAYWRWALDVANNRRERLGLPRNPKWDDVRDNLAPLPQKDGFYVHSAEWLDTFEKRKWEHPDLVGIWGVVPPTDAVDRATAERTLERIEKEWDWNRCWGWDFPWLAIAGARLQRPDLALEGLMTDAVCNRYGLSGVNLGGPSARGGKGAYLPGNAALLYAIAGMCAGFDETSSDGATANDDMPQSGDAAPGFPDGWQVKWENLKRPL